MRGIYKKRKYVVACLENLDFVKRIHCEQHAWNFIKDRMIDYPATIGIPLLEMAKERPINVFIGYQPCKDIVKPQLKVDGNNVTIMMNY